MMTDSGEVLDKVLERSRDFGFLGPGSTRTHVENGRAFVAALEGLGSGARILDLGSGGGVPGLIIGSVLADTRVVLLDAAERRVVFLEEAVAELGLRGRVEVVRGRAEEVARDERLRGSFDVVTARSFAPPPVTAECAAGFMAGAGSRLLVSEPPRGGDSESIDVDPLRWPTEPLNQLGLKPGRLWRSEGTTIQQLDMIAPCPNSTPRRVGVPTRRPLY